MTEDPPYTLDIAAKRVEDVLRLTKLHLRALRSSIIATRDLTYAVRGLCERIDISSNDDASALATLDAAHGLASRMAELYDDVVCDLPEDDDGDDDEDEPLPSISPPPRPPEMVYRKILTVIADASAYGDGALVSDICDETALPALKLKGHLRTLRDRGLLTTNGRTRATRWCITSKGLKALQR